MAGNFNFNGAARLLTTTDLDTIGDPASDMGAAMVAVLGSLNVTANLPTGGATGTILTKLSGADGDAGWTAPATTDISGLTAALAAKADSTTVASLTTVVGTKAPQTSLDSTNTAVALKASQSALDTLTTTVAGKATTAALAALQFTDLADVDGVTPFVDGDFPNWDEAGGQFTPVDPATRFAAADASTGQTLVEATAPNVLFGFIIPEGSDPPAGLPLGAGVPILGFETTAPPDLTPVLSHANYAQASSTVVLTLTQTLAIGDKFGVAIGWENATNGGNTPPDHFDLTFSGSGAATVTKGTVNGPNTSAGVELMQAVVTTALASGSTITVTARKADNSATNRAHLFAAAYSTPSALAVFDQYKVSPSGSSSSNMSSVTVAADADSAGPDALDLGVVCWSAGSIGTTRTLAGTNGWAALTTMLSNNGSSQRGFGLFWKARTSIGHPTLTTLMTASDSATGQWAGIVADVLKA